MKNQLYLCLLGLVFAFCSSCNDSKGASCVSGMLGCACIDGERCDFGLTCLDGVCSETVGGSDSNAVDSETTPADSDSDTNLPDSDTNLSDSDTQPVDTDTYDDVDGGDDGGSEDSCDESIQDWDAEFVTLEEQFLGLLNDKRSAGVTCGGIKYDSVGELTMNDQMRSGDRFFVCDMYTRDYGPQDEELNTCEWGATAAARASSAGFTGTVSGWGARHAERNTPLTPPTILDDMLADEVKCKRVMDSTAEYAGVGYAEYPSDQKDYVHYILSYSIGGAIPD